MIIYMTKVMGEDNGFAAIQAGAVPASNPVSCISF